MVCVEVEVVGCIVDQSAAARGKAIGQSWARQIRPVSKREKIAKSNRYQLNMTFCSLVVQRAQLFADDISTSLVTYPDFVDLARRDVDTCPRPKSLFPVRIVCRICHCE